MIKTIAPIIFFTLFLSPVCLTVVLGEERSPLVLEVNEGSLQRLNAPVLDILISNPEIADIQLTQGNGIFVYGKKPGRTHIMALASGDTVIFDRQIQVIRDLKALTGLIKRQFPTHQIRLEDSPGRLLVSGEVSSPLVMENVISLVRGYLQQGEKIVNQLNLLSPLQVNLRVRIMEVNRQATEELGINWDILLNPGSLAVGLISGRSPLQFGGEIIPKSDLIGAGSSALLGANGSDGSISAVIDALSEENLVTVLAEPNLTSRSGETAGFFAGGEFPIPIAADNNRITIEFKKFGVILDMTPTVISQDRINLHIRSEVSELSSAGAVVVQNISIPGIAIRRAEATIELASGQSFSVAGLLQNQSRNLITEVPWLGDIAILGPLFRSNKYQRSETELVIIATANIVQPISTANYRSPLGGIKTENDPFEMQKGKLLKNYPNREQGDIKGRSGLQLYGPRGFMY